ncbi:MAG TPA: HAMP domain-containing sensor histidine kinase [Actinomycetota bacterium]|nr:HAMP domain-containing sensor histidine kinase [Actinomycetota bacterium]
MARLTELRRLERGMTRVRWFGAAFGALSIALQEGYPSRATEIAAWALIGALAVGNLVIWGVQGRVDTVAAQRRLGDLAFAFDALVIGGIVWVFSFEDPYATWALLFVVPMEGALRYRFRGAVGAAAAVAVFFAAQSVHVADIRGEAFDLSTYVFVMCLSFLIAGVTGSMAENWHAQSEALRVQGLRLAELDRLKDRFLAITSHEIRGPLTALIGGIDTVRKRADTLTPEQKNGLLDMTAQQGRQLARMVDDLLLTSQLQGGNLKLHPHPCNLRETVQGALDAAASKRRDHRLEVFVEPLTCVVDGARISQVVRNLVENAYKYTPKRTRVSVTAGADRGGITIEVEDDGPGIPAEKRDTMFHAFTRVEETAAGREGAGLGLFVVGQLVEAMGGHIDVSSSSGGTCFAIHVPCETSELKSPRLSVVDPERSAGG